MAASRTFGSERAQEARLLYDAGLGCNAIAKQLGVAPSTISDWAKREGLSFDRSLTAVAVAAHTMDLAAARVMLAQEMSETAFELLRARNGPYLVYSFGGRDNDYNEHTLDRPPVEVIRNMVTTAGIAFDKASKVVESQLDPGEVGAKAMLRKLGEALGVVA